MLAQGLGRKKSLDISIWEIPRIRDTIVGFPGKKATLHIGVTFFSETSISSQKNTFSWDDLVSRTIASLWRALRVAEQV